MKAIVTLICLNILVVLAFAVHVSNEQKVFAQNTGYSSELVEIDVNGQKVVPKNGKINIMTFEPSQVVVSGNNIIMRNYTATSTDKPFHPVVPVPQAPAH